MFSLWTLTWRSMCSSGCLWIDNIFANIPKSLEKVRYFIKKTEKANFYNSVYFIGVVQYVLLFQELTLVTMMTKSFSIFTQRLPVFFPIQRNPNVFFFTMLVFVETFRLVLVVGRKFPKLSRSSNTCTVL